MSPNSPTEGPAQIFTVGYGNRTPEQLFDLIKARGCGYLVDVRSVPYSSYHKDFNRESLERCCDDFGLKYLYLGDQVGGKPDPEDLDELDRADYKLMAQKPRFLEGVERLETAQKKGISLALMCAELRPETCHRTKLIGEVLRNRGVELVHIDEDAKLLSQSEVLKRLDNGQEDLFG